jgi:hypothetical protein
MSVGVGLVESYFVIFAFSYLVEPSKGYIIPLLKEKNTKQIYTLLIDCYSIPITSR